MAKIHIIPCLSDNYAYLIENEESKHAILIDAPEAAPINAALKALDLQLSAIFITHHHADHIDGIAGVNPGSITVFGNEKDAARLPTLDYALKAGEELEVLGFRIQVLPADGHTIGHIAFYLPNEKALFSADSLMLWGCGRLFEGSPGQMLETLDRFAALPDDTLIYSGHNYGVGNGNFALSLGYKLEEMNARMAKIKAQNAAGEPVVPASLALEKATNPFLMARDDALADLLGIKSKSAVDRFAHIRKMKDSF